MTVLILGAGPAGLAAAIAAAESGAPVTVLERMPRAGLKLLATGGGRCNLTNTAPPEEFRQAFGRRGRFIDPALAALSPADLRRLLADEGVATAADDGFHVFPCSQCAGDVLAALEARARRAGARIDCGCEAVSVCVEDGAVTGVETRKEEYAAGRVIIATGGRGYPALGSTGLGFALAAACGHRVVGPHPALAPLLVAEPWVSACAGIVLTSRVWIEAAPATVREGEILFTHRGLSGPAVLALSGDVAEVLSRTGEPVELRLALVAGTRPQEWLARFDAWSHEHGARQVARCLDAFLPGRLANHVCAHCGCAGTRVAELPRAARERLAGALVGVRVTVTGTEGWDRAMVTRGGVALKDVDPRTLASRRVRGLYFAGEVVDLDGPCGGYNLQWAFSSGWLAGRSAARAAGE